MIGTVVVTEFIKLRRSVVPWITLAVMLAGPWVLALFMWIIREPERAASLGLMGTKANLAGLEATWPAFGNYVSVLVGAAGMLVLAFRFLFQGNVTGHRKTMRHLYLGACVVAGLFTLSPHRLLGQLVWGQWLGLV